MQYITHNMQSVTISYFALIHPTLQWIAKMGQNTRAYADRFTRHAQRKQEAALQIQQERGGALTPRKHNNIILISTSLHYIGACIPPSLHTAACESTPISTQIHQIRCGFCYNVFELYFELYNTLMTGF